MKVRNSIVKKILTGGGNRPSRFHTEDGKLPPVLELAKLPLAALSWAKVRITGARPVRPWWPMPVIPLIDDLINKDMDVVEFGSGNSTVWLAERARTVLAIESHDMWHNKVRSELETRGLSNASVVLRCGEEYHTFHTQDPEYFDLAIIDGDYRWRCIESVLPRMRAGGLIYLDNSDSDKDTRFYSDPNDKFLAQKILRRTAESTPGARKVRISGFVDGEVYVGSGTLLVLPTK